MSNLAKQTERYINILNIPTLGGIQNFFPASENPDNNWYYYLFDLNIINRTAYDKIVDQKELIIGSHFLSSYLKEFTKTYVIKDSAAKEHVVDFGTGYGFLAFWLAQFENKIIYAIGYPSQIEVLQKIYLVAKEQKLFAESSEIIFLAQPLTLRSVILDPLIKPESLDQIILNDVIEHFHPTLYYNLCLASYNSLKKGGLFISKSHNTDNSTTLNRLKYYWEACENEYLNKNRILFIRNKYAIDEEKAAALAKNTRGYTADAIDAAVTLFKETGNILPFNKNLVPIDVDLDNYMLENYVSPEFFKTFLGLFGFKTTLSPGLHSSRRLSIFSPLAKVWPKTLLKIKYFSAVIIIRAVKM